MKNAKLEKQPSTQPISLDALTARINEREKKIDLTCVTAVKHAMDAVQLAIDQGNDLMTARSMIANASRGKFQKQSDTKGWQRWLLDNFPKSDDTARRYMALAEKVKTAHGRVLPHDIKSIREAFRVLGLLPEVEPERQLPSINVSPIVSKLNFVAEWVSKSGWEEISKWEKIQRDELKLQLKPVVELFEKL